MGETRDSRIKGGPEPVGGKEDEAGGGEEARVKVCGRIGGITMDHGLYGLGRILAEAWTRMLLILRILADIFNCWSFDGGTWNAD